MFPWKNQSIFDKHVNSKLSVLFKNQRLMTLKDFGFHLMKL